MKLSKLINVSKPARYLGGELNSINKNQDNLLNFCLIFSDIYEIGTSHVGYRILYELVNKSDKVYCQRFFAPWKDALDYFGSEIFVSLEKKKPLREFDVLGFSLHYEMSYTTTLAILKHSGISIYSTERKEDDPVIMAGGSCVYNPAPLKPFIDAFYVGEGDIGLRKVLESIKDLKDSGASRRDILEHLNSYPFIYVPVIDADKQVKRDIYLDFNNSSTIFHPVVPLIPAIQDRVSVEIARGCTAGCRFCQAGMIYRPVRERDCENVISDVNNQIEATGYREASLLSLSTGDYSQIEPLVMDLNKELADKHVSLSTPSLRASSVSERLFLEISKVRKSGFTIAPEAGSQRMRNVINKNLSEEDILNAVVLAAKSGYTGVKLYFMIGLPFETDEDILGIADTASKIKYAVKQAVNINFDVSVSVSHFVPKPHTPFQRFGQVKKAELERRMYMLKDELKRRKFKFKFHDTRMSVLESFVSRGGEKTAKVLAQAVEEGFYLDSWDDFFDYNSWIELSSRIGVDIEYEASKGYEDDDILPWDNIGTGVKDRFYKKEVLKAIEEQETVDCRNGKCSACGVCDFKTLEPVKADYDEKVVEKHEEVKEYQKYEVIYKKYGNGVFFSALDLSRLFAHSLIVSGVELAYSQGFNPHPKINTWVPVPLGMKGENEVMSFEAVKIADLNEFIRVFNSYLPEGLEAKSIKLIDTMKTGTDFKSTYTFNDETYNVFLDIYNKNGAEYSKLDKKGREKKVLLDSFLVDFNKESKQITTRISNDGSFNFYELLKGYMPLEDIDITRLSVVKDEREC